MVKDRAFKTDNYYTDFLFSLLHFFLLFVFIIELEPHVSHNICHISLADLISSKNCLIQNSILQYCINETDYNGYLFTETLSSAWSGTLSDTATRKYYFVKI